MVGSDWGRRAQRAWRVLAAVAALGLMAQARETNKKGRCGGLCAVRLAAPMTDV